MSVDQNVMVFSKPSLQELQNYDEAYRKTENVMDIPKEYYLSPNDVTINPQGSKIIQFFKGKHVFLTGGTGFVGVLTVEKLLRACPDIGRIYILMRSKKGKNVNERMDKYVQNAVFDPLRKIFPNFQDKITAVSGDAAMDKLGLSEEDRNTLIKNVQIIIHGAATVNFDEKFKTAVNINVRGTKFMLDLAKECEKLVVFVQISTAFSSTNNNNIQEEFLPYDESVEEILNIVEKHSEEELENISKKYMGDFPNTYAFTKFLTEQIVKQYSPQLPIVCYRPAMIIPTYREPIRGWTNNIYGPVAVMFLKCLGLQHILLADPNCSGSFVPCDYVVNALIAVAYKTAQDKSQIGKVYNFANKPSVQMTHSDLVQNSLDLKDKLITTRTKLHIYCLLKTTNVNLFRFFGFFLHYIPALFMDFGLKIAGIKLPMKVADAMKKVHKLMELVRYYNVRQWKFTYENVDNLWKELSLSDKNAFPFNLHEVNPKLHLINIYCGLRIYLARDPLETIPAARKQYQKIEYAFRGLYIVLAIILFIFLNKIYNFIFL